MLSRIQRLRLQRDIDAVQRYGRSIGNRHFFIKFIPSKSKISRATVVVSVKAAKKAVDRNRIKRRVRSILEKNLRLVSKPHDLMIIIKKSALSLSFAELNRLLTSQIQKI